MRIRREGELKTFRAVKKMNNVMSVRLGMGESCTDVMVATATSSMELKLKCVWEKEQHKLDFIDME